jgi:hypothetical protein
LKVSRRGGFSDRNKIKPENTTIQLYDFDIRTRKQLQTLINSVSALAQPVLYDAKVEQDYIRYVQGNIYGESVNPLRQYSRRDIDSAIMHTIMHDDYDDVLTLIEGLIQYWDLFLKKYDRSYCSYGGDYVSKSLFEIANSYFEREYIGYRFIDRIITPISDEYEIRVIEDALAIKYEPVYQHLSKANLYLSNRERPDYENSIKESISAVEAICEILTGLSGADANLGNMLKKLESSGVIIHGGLKTAFRALYGYTSDAKGIRHAGDIGGPSSTFEEAKFMLISCSAFINYLKALSAD